MQPDLETRAQRFVAGVDIGGTHTDLIVSSPGGLVRSKSFTTHEDYSRGVFAALDGAAYQLDVDTRDLLAGCQAFVASSTLVTNIVTEQRGPRVGVLITEGFKDTFRVARGARKAAYDDHVQANPPEVTPRNCIEEISERTLADGAEAVALDEQDVRDAVVRLQAAGVDAYAVCYLWSFRAPSHERRTAEIIREIDPGAVVMLSSVSHPVIRETERFYTTVFDAMAHSAVARFVDQISGELANNGFTGALSFFQGVGGSMSGEAIKSKPMAMLASGPAGGLMGARATAKMLGITDVIVGDMGGTSFDTSLLPGLEPALAKRVTFDQIPTGVDILDVVSVGAGGGSVAWLDSRGVPQVGPHSSGSVPGPVCYGVGGTAVTVTDACVTLGLIDPTNYLGGRFRLDRAAGAAAIEEQLAKPLGWTIDRAAAGIYDIATANMADAMRTVSVERGYDPRNFDYLAYGGGMGMFAAEVGRRLGCRRILVPDNCSAFSAQGVVTADYVRQYNRTVNWVLSDASDTDRINTTIRQLRSDAIEDARNDGFSDLEFSLSGDCCFAGQVWEITVPLPDREFAAAEGPELAERFPELYEQAYGEGTAWRDSPALLVNLGLRATSSRPKPVVREAEPQHSRPEPHSVREMYLPVERRSASVNVYAEVDLTPGAEVEGPCIVDAGDTTIYVPIGFSCERDRYYNYSLVARAEVSS